MFRVLGVQRFRGGLVFKARRLLYHSTLGSRVINKKRSIVGHALFLALHPCFGFRAKSTSLFGSKGEWSLLSLTSLSRLSRSLSPPAQRLIPGSASVFRVSGFAPKSWMDPRMFALTRFSVLNLDATQYTLDCKTDQPKPCFSSPFKTLEYLWGKNRSFYNFLQPF